MRCLAQIRSPGSPLPTSCPTTDFQDFLILLAVLLFFHENSSLKGTIIRKIFEKLLSQRKLVSSSVLWHLGFRASLLLIRGSLRLNRNTQRYPEVLLPDLLPTYNDPNHANPQLWLNPIIHFIYSCCQATENYKSQLTGSHYKSMLFHLGCSLILLFILINCLSCSIWQQFQSILLFYNLKIPQTLLSEPPTSLKNLRFSPSSSLSFTSK